MATNELFTRVNIGKMRLKNRIIMCPMGNKTDPDGGVQERNIDYFVERAKGGCGAIFTGAFMCTEEFETRGCNVIYNFSHVDRLNLLVDKVHEYDCKLVVQLTAGLGRMGYTDPTRPPYSASDTETFYFKGVRCKPFLWSRSITWSRLWVTPPCSASVPEPTLSNSIATAAI